MNSVFHTGQLVRTSAFQSLLQPSANEGDKDSDEFEDPGCENADIAPDPSAIELESGVAKKYNALRILRGADLVWTPLSEVRFFRAQRKYTSVFLQSQDGLLRSGLTHVEGHLPREYFWRIHRGLILNVTHMQSARRDEFGRLVVRLRDRDELLIVSKPYEHLFREGFCY